MPSVTAFRAFPWDRAARENEPGGARHVNRAKQGSGRHDFPASYGVYYCSATAESAIGESLQMYRGQKIERPELTKFGLPLALVEIELHDTELVDLDDPPRLIEHDTKPSIVASSRRDRTQDLARRIFDTKAKGISWWSTLISDWTNYSVFTSGDEVTARIRRGPDVVTLAHPSLRTAADKLGIRL